jgi:hypothetical protein
MIASLPSGGPITLEDLVLGIHEICDGIERNGEI